jgi:glycosyltransferase involved in cell wall biosynthesis
MTEQKTYLSIIIPNYNNAKYLPACLESVCAINIPNTEILIIDDCSTDNSMEILQDFAAKDPRIIIHQMDKNSGVGAVRNYGIENARGEYFFFIDSDDLMDASGVSSLMRTILATGADIVVGQYIAVPETFFIKPNNIESMVMNFRFSEFAYEFAHMIPDLSLVTVWGKIFHRDLISKFRFKTDIYPNEDVEFMLRLYSEMKLGCHAYFNTIYYRQSETSVIKEKKRDISDDIIKVIRNLIFFISCPAPEKNKAEYLKYVMYIKEYLYNFIIGYMYRMKRLIKAEKDKTLRKSMCEQRVKVGYFVGEFCTRAGLFKEMNISLGHLFGIWLLGNGCAKLGSNFLLYKRKPKI